MRQLHRGWLNPHQVLCFKSFFFRVSREITKRLDSDPHRDERGLTDEFVRELLHNEQNIERLSRRLRESGLFVNLAVRKMRIDREEKTTGADIGFVLTIVSPEIDIEKALLIQAKRLKPHNEHFDNSSKYGDLLEKHGKDQAAQMVEHTAASFFLLYSPSLWNISGISGRLRKYVNNWKLRRYVHNYERYLDNCEHFLEIWEELYLDDYDRYFDEYKRHLPGYRRYLDDYERCFSPFSFPLPFYPSISSSLFSPAFLDNTSILPATTVLSLNENSDLEKIEKYTLSFVDFMVDDFFQCKIGDGKTEILKISRGESEKYTVDYVVDFKVMREWSERHGRKMER